MEKTSNDMQFPSEIKLHWQKVRRKEKTYHKKLLENK